MPVIPVDIIESIVDNIADIEGSHSRVSNSIASLSACALTAHAFYWPAMKKIYREVHLHTQDPKFRRLVLNRLDPDEGSMDIYSTPRLRQFLDITTRNPGLLHVIQSVHLYISSDYLQEGRPEELWNILEYMLHSKEEMYIKYARIHSSQHWLWMDNISELRGEILFKLIQSVTDELTLDGLLIKPSTIGLLLKMFNCVRRISFTRIEARRFFAGVTENRLPTIFVRPEGGKVVEPLPNVAINISLPENVLFLDATLETSYKSLVFLELNYLNLHLFRSYGLRCDLAYLTALQGIHIKFVLKYQCQTDECRSGYRSVKPTYGTPLLYLSSRNIVEAFVPTATDSQSPIMREKTRLKTIAIHLTLMYDIRDLTALYRSLQSWNSSSQNPPPPIDLDEWKWSDFHPSDFRKKHPELQELRLKIMLAIREENKGDNDAVLSEYKYGFEKHHLEVLLGRLIWSTIVGALENVPESDREHEVLRVDVMIQ